MAGQSYDNALAETVNGYYKAELIYGPEQGPWRNVDEVGLATLSWVYWFNADRTTTATATTTSRPTSSKRRFMLPNRSPRPGLETNGPSLHQTQGDSVSGVVVGGT